MMNTSSMNTSFSRVKVPRLFVAALLPALFTLGACTTTYDWREVAGPARQAPRVVQQPATVAAPPQNTQDIATDFAAYAGERVFFDFDRSVIRNDARATLDKQAEWLNRYPTVTVRIEGNTDDRGTREYNLALGERRANAAKNYLTGLGIDASRLSTVSYGKERPLALGSDEASWARNRRAVTVTID